MKRSERNRIFEKKGWKILYSYLVLLLLIYSSWRILLLNCNKFAVSFNVIKGLKGGSIKIKNKFDFKKKINCVAGVV